MHVGKSRKDFNVAFFSRRFSSFFRVLIGLQAMPSILGYSTYRIQVEPGTRTQHLQHQFGMCIYALPALAFSHCRRSDFGHIRLLCKKAKKKKSDDINLDSSGCFGCTCHYLRLGTSPKSHESAVDRYCRWRTEELQTEDAVDVKSSNGFGISLQIAKFR